MGLDWYLQAKMENGRQVDPPETAGLQYLDRGDPDSVEKFRVICEQKKAEHEDPGSPPVPEAKPGGLKGLLDGISRSGRDRRYRNGVAQRRWEAKKRQYDYWHRPFDAVLDETANAAEKFIVQYAAPDRQDALARFLGTGDVYDFRGNELREDINLFSSFAFSELGEFWPMEVGNDQSPEGMLKLADDIERSLRAFREAGRDKAGEDEDQDDIDFCIEIAEAAIPWLRFWATHGHSFVADW